MDLNYHSMKSPHLIVIGGGFAGLKIIKELNKKNIKVTVFDKNNYHTFQPLLYQVASGGLGEDAIAYPLRKIVSECPNIAFRMAEVQSINFEEKYIVSSIGNYSYDYLCIATGSETNFFGNKSLENNAFQLKSIQQSLDLRNQILREFEIAVSENRSGKVERVLNFVVVGGGPTGVETAGALAEIQKNVIPEDYKELDNKLMQVYLVEAGNKILASMSEISSLKAKKFLEDLGVKVLLSTSVENFDGNIVKLSNGETIESKTLIWSAGVKGKILENFPSKFIVRGNRIKVNAFNQVEGLENVFAIGDVAWTDSDTAYEAGHPMVASVAVQQAKLFSENIFAYIENKEKKEFKYFDKGSMATVGRHKAVFELFSLKMQGAVAWLGWMFLHLMLLVGFRNRMIVFINWLWNYITYSKAIRIIIEPEKKIEKG